MNLKQMMEFREIMRTGSVSQAARNLNRTQPAISASLKALEADLNLTLFERSGRRLHPVPEAHYLLSEADEIIHRMETARRNMRSLRDQKSGVLKIAAMPGPSAFLLPKLISEFTQGCDNIQVTLTTRSSPQVHQLLATQSYDLGIADTMHDGNVDASLMVSDVVDSICLVAVRNDHPLAEQETIKASQLDGLPLGVLHAEQPTRRQIESAFSTCGAAFNAKFETQYFLPLYEMVENGQALAVVDKLSAASFQHYRRENSRIVFRTFAPMVKSSITLLKPRHRALSKLALSFADQWQQLTRHIGDQTVFH